jgi:hypothetical protein
MPCNVIVGHFYRDPESKQLFEVTHVMPRMIRVIDCQADEPRLLNRMQFERDCEQVSA